MAKNTPKLSTMVAENFRITHLKWLKIHLKLSTMVGENFRITYLKWLKIYLNYPWLEKILELLILNGKKCT